MSIVSLRQLRNKVYTNMCNLFTMELNIIVCNVTIRQLRYKFFNNMSDLFILEFNIFLCNVVISQLGNKTFNNMCNLFTIELNIVVCNVGLICQKDGKYSAFMFRLCMQYEAMFLCCFVITFITWNRFWKRNPGKI